MTNNQIKLHYYQSDILRKLVVEQTVKFNDLLIAGLESEHMNYHLKKLIDLGLVSKDEMGYQLTDSGKDYSSMLDDNIEVVEKQPKTSVLVRGVRENRSGEIEHLLNVRLRQPYLGMVGRIGGKVRFGESLQEAAARELIEETGLIAKTYQLEEIYHKVRFREDGTCVQDVLFYIFLAKDFNGDFIEKTPYQENMWVTSDQFKNRTDLAGFDDLEFYDSLEPKELEWRESIALARNF